jgi:hypothetical protein
LVFGRFRFVVRLGGCALEGCVESVELALWDFEPDFFRTDFPSSGGTRCSNALSAVSVACGKWVAIQRSAGFTQSEEVECVANAFVVGFLDVLGELLLVRVLMRPPLCDFRVFRPKIASLAFALERNGLSLPHAPARYAYVVSSWSSS